VDHRADALYHLPPERFVAARDALARELRAAGDREGAAEVKALARPSAAAAAVNRFVRERRDAADALWAAADELVAAQRGALGPDRPRRGAGAAAVRQASAAERRALDGALEAVRELDAPSQATLERVRAILRGAAADPAVREAVRAGRLSREPDPSTTDPLAALAASLEGVPQRGPETTKESPPKPAAKQARAGEPARPRLAKDAAPPRDPAAEREQARRAALEHRLSEARAVEAETARAAAAAQEIAEDRGGAARTAREAAERARAEAADAQTASRDAQVQAEEAAEALVRAQRSVQRLEDQLGSS
jgi:hypothetical protein